ncbi:hypothetical protein X777_03181 [Ooceraea biroi]|uniref:Uncharacterized protein n=1 Tax=Ooceraea biroi TaxID=2015173 RepID=A0A026VUY7_OOCBI|nr:hypothetical protein X777_03181 [Ooceraea biroi]
MLVGAVIETIIEGIVASLTDDTLPEIANDYRYHRHHDQRDNADTHINRARNPNSYGRMYVLLHRLQASVTYDMRECVSERKIVARLFLCDDVRQRRP